MSIPQPIFNVLRVIDHHLHEASLTWAITGSCSLALQGVPVAVHDIDLRTTAHDAYVLEAVFHAWQRRPVAFASTDTVRSHFGALDVNGIQVEIIGDMQHRLEDGTWEPLVDMNRFKVWVEVKQLRVPVMSLPFLYNAYQLLGRTDKVTILQEWLIGEAVSPVKPSPNSGL